MKNEIGESTNPIAGKLLQNPLAWLFGFLTLRLILTFFAHSGTFYADEFRDYFVTLHGLVHQHELGEWYVAKGMRSYVLLLPLLPVVWFYKLAGGENLYVLQQILQGYVGLFSYAGVYFTYRFAVERWQDPKKAFVVGLLYILHATNLYYSQSLLTEHATALIFIFQLWLVNRMLLEPTSRTFLSYFWFWLTAGFAVMARLDAVFFSASIIVFYFWQVKKEIQWAPLLSSLFVAFVGYGLLEMAFTGVFYGPELNRFINEAVVRKGNIGNEGDDLSFQGRLRTINDAAGNTGHIFFIVAMFHLFKTIRRPGLYHFPILLSLLFLIWLPHKETRYLHPISFVIVLYLFEVIPSYYLQNLKKIRVVVFWGLSLVVWVVVFTKFIPWEGKPDLTPQIAKVNLKYPDTPVFVADLSDSLGGYSLRILKGFVNYSDVQTGQDLPDGELILFVHQDNLKPWLDKVQGCEEFFTLPLNEKGKRQNIHHDFKHYYCK